MSSNPLLSDQQDSQGCFHCGEPVPQGLDFKVIIDGEPRAMCCPGCQAVARTIVDSG
ncbi:MAG: hypothetical protein GWO08_06185, partial [Gammaproteobacteria bacterium]|nr:hypothetical protein [Gammaproteobacteria bacterium]